jgi:NAD(P)H dehydrogenase (quinone)
MAFDPILHEGFERIQPLEPELASAHDAIFAADHMLLIFPLWLGDMPAILKGFLERVLQPDVIEPYKKGKFVKLLKGKTARIVITMGMPGFFYKLWFGAPALKVLRRAILHPMGVSPIRTTLLGRVDGVGDKGRQIWLTRLEQLGRRAA